MIDRIAALTKIAVLGLSGLPAQLNTAYNDQGTVCEFTFVRDRYFPF
jgi:hypothetical protein